jgi:hypothetical protein
VAQARASNATLPIIARGHSEAEAEYLKACAPPAFRAEKIADAMAGRIP